MKWAVESWGSPFSNSMPTPEHGTLSWRGAWERKRRNERTVHCSVEKWSCCFIKCTHERMREARFSGNGFESKYAPCACARDDRPP